MENQEIRIEKICSFYVSDWHLAMMMMPYLKEKIEHKIRFQTILEKDIKMNILEIMSKINIEKNIKEKIKNINWSPKKILKYEEIEKELIKNKKEEQIILISGNEKYIENANINIEKYFSKNEIGKVKIINFYEMTEFNEKMEEILNKHDRILNTSGERNIEEVYDGYKKAI